MIRLPGAPILALAASTQALLLPSGCGTDAVGVEDCRKIESARCEAASHCGSSLSVTNAQACQRFYRTQCLHGLTSGKEPGAGEVQACVQVIQAAGRCAEGLDPAAPLSDCGEMSLARQSNPVLVGACDVVKTPELTDECAFLAETPPAADAGSGPAEASSADAGKDSGSGSAGAPAE